MKTEISKELLDKINHLAKKQREEGLTEEEEQVQGALRQKYLNAFRARFKKVLDRIEIVDEGQKA